jgi:hypothetical protein
MSRPLIGCDGSSSIHVATMTNLNAALLVLGIALLFAFTLFIGCRLLPSAQKPYLRPRKSRTLSDPADLV